MYLAAQGDNPFGSTFALLPGPARHRRTRRPDQDPGPDRRRSDHRADHHRLQRHAAVPLRRPDPEVPLSGPRAPLVNPPTCGTQTIGVEVASYAQPQNPVDVSNTYEVSEGPNGTPCPPDSARRPFPPRFSGGTLNPVAGAYSPFLFRLSRDDDEQELSQVTTVLPPGLVAKIAGIPFCPDAAIASISTAEGAGAAES